MKQPRPLTPHQQALWDLKSAGRKDAEIAQAMQISVNNVRKTLSLCRKKLGIRLHGGPPPWEVKDPEKSAVVLDAMSDPRFTTLTEACKAAGLPDRVSKHLIARLRLKYLGVIHEAKNLQKRDLDELLGKKIHMMLHYIDDTNASQASARDLAMGAAQLIEKQQLIRGEPTAIVSDHERKKLHELAPALLKEITRRGITLDGQVTEKTVEPART